MGYDACVEDCFNDIEYMLRKDKVRDREVLLAWARVVCELWCRGRVTGYRYG